MNIKQALSMNLKYYRKQFNLSQEKFAFVLGTTLPYLNKIENCKVDFKSSTLEKFTNNINKYNKDINIKPYELIIDNPNHKTNFTRIDEKK